LFTCAGVYRKASVGVAVSWKTLKIMRTCPRYVSRSGRERVDVRIVVVGNSSEAHGNRCPARK
jgi:hypothetical protein